MSILLGKYKNKRRLGGGAYGDVQLVTDQKGCELAIKMISKKLIKYIEGEKECMMSVKNPYVIELFDVEEDERYKYFICEYCDGGDLLSLQAKQYNKVFALKQATKILSQVILGLEHIHKTGYLHRDIKLQNILVKKDASGNHIYKIADFGFAKRLENVSGTVLGTENYMSPQIFQNQLYSYQVDMWAFGVLFYFMLNMEFPYSIPAHATIQKKRFQIIKQTQNFSYEANVKQSNKKLMQNCTPQVQDLFNKIFNINPTKRIDFCKIRSHPIFKQYFPNTDKGIISFYQQINPINRFDSFKLAKNSNITYTSKAPPKYTFQRLQQSDDEIDISPSCFLKKPKASCDQKQVLQLELQKVKFLNQASQQIAFNLSFVDSEQILAFRYNVLKYYVVLLRELYKSMNPQFYANKYPKLKWSVFFKTNEAKSTITQIKQLLAEMEMKVSQTYDQCKKQFTAVQKFNPKIQTIFQQEVSQTEFTQALKTSYRFSTSGLYTKLRQRMNNNNVYAYLTLLVFLIHAFNNFIKQSQEGLKQTFTDFVKDNKCNIIDFRELRGWMSGQSKQKLKSIISNLHKKYFPSSA